MIRSSTGFRGTWSDSCGGARDEVVSTARARPFCDAAGFRCLCVQEGYAEAAVSEEVQSYADSRRGKGEHLGMFSTAEAGARAYDR